MKSYILLILSCIVLVTASSCGSSKPTSAGTKQDTNIPVSDTPLASRMSSVVTSAQPAWTNLSVPMSVSATAPSRFSVSTKAFFTRDKSVYFAITVLGMEMAAIQVTNDSIFAVDKIHKLYVAEDIASVTSTYPVSVATLQAMLSGQPFLPGTDSLNEENIRDFRMDATDNTGTWYAQPRNQPSPFCLTFSFSDDNALTGTIISDGNRNFSLQYSDRIATLNLPQSESLLVNAGKVKVNATLKWSWHKARFDNPSDNKQIKINKSYTRVTPQQLLAAFS